MLEFVSQPCTNADAAFLLSQACDSTLSSLEMAFYSARPLSIQNIENYLMTIANNYR